MGKAAFGENLETFEEAGREFCTSGVNTTFFAYKIPGKYYEMINF